MKIVFMGTPDFAKESLEALYNAKYEILAVVTNPDRPKGRGMKMIASPVKEFALEKGIKIYQPEKVRNNEEFISEIKALKPDVICVVAYGKILPKEILEIPSKGCINVHGSLLPKYRGAAPIQWAVLNGDKKTGVTTMYMDVGMDTGDMILKQETQIGEDETTGELWDRLSKIGGKLLVETLKQIEEGTAPREKQGEEFTMAPMLNKEMSKICLTFLFLYDIIIALLSISLVFAVLIFILCPLDTPEKPLNDKEYKYFRKISWIILSLIIVAIIVSFIFKFNVVFAPCCASLILEGVLIGTGKIKKVYNEKRASSPA